MATLSEFAFLILVLVIAVCMVVGSWSLYSIAMNLDIMTLGYTPPVSELPETPSIHEPEPPAKLDPIPEPQAPPVDAALPETDLSGSPDNLPIVIPHSVSQPKGAITPVLD